MNPLAVITGTTHGIGRPTATALARAGFHVVMLCRNLPLAARVSDEIRGEIPSATVEVLRCDLLELRSVRDAGIALRERFGPIALLVLNAGMASVRAQRAGNGMDLNFAVNHLGHFLLTELVRERMAPGSRLITVASHAHYRGTLDLDTVGEHWEGISATASYARSKLANVLHNQALARRFEDTTVAVNSLHPGIVATHLLPWWVQLFQRLRGHELFDERRGAKTTLRLALGDEFGKCRGYYFDENARQRRPSALALDVALQEALWERSLAWVKPWLDGAPAR